MKHTSEYWKPVGDDYPGIYVYVGPMPRVDKDCPAIKEMEEEFKREYAKRFGREPSS